MTRTRAAWLVFNAAIVILVACMLGVPYGEAAKAGAGLPNMNVPGTEAQWRLAHMEGLVNGILILAVGGAATLLTMSRKAETATFWGLLATAWGNLLGALFAALGGDRILGFGVGDSNPLAMFCFSVAAAGAVVALTALAVTAFRTASTACNRDQTLSGLA